MRIREVAEVNPSVPEFDSAPSDSAITFVPLEAVWPGTRLDLSRVRLKADVATGYVRFREGDILVPKVTPTFQAARSALAITVPTVIGTASTEVHTVRVRPGNDPRYVMYAFHTERFLGEGVATFQGVAGLQRVPDAFLRDFRIRRRPVLEQQRIADFLDDQVACVDEIIRLRRDQITALESRFNSRIRDLVAGAGAGALVSEAAPWIGLLHRDAEVRPLRRSLVLQRGVDLTADQQIPGSVPVVTTGGVVGMHDRAIATGPGVVIGRYGTVGNVHWIDQPFWPHNTTLYVKDFRGNRPRWVYWLLRAFPYAMQQARSAVPGVNRNEMHPVLMPWLPDGLQAFAAKALDEEQETTKAVTDLLRSEVALLQERKRSLITAAVTGEFDVASASGRGVA